MSDESAEKQHQATGKRLNELRKQGQTMRSRDLTSGLVFMMGIIVLLYIAHHIKVVLEDNFVESFGYIHNILSVNEFPPRFFKKLIIDNVLMVLPLFLFVVVIALLSPFIFGGWNFTMQPMHFKWTSLNLIKNLGNIFSKKVAMNVVKSVLKVTVIISVLVLFAMNKKSEILKLITLPYVTSLLESMFIIKQFIILISISLTSIILFDVLTNYFEFNKRIKMTSQELKDEFKEAEGNSDVKRKLKSMQIALLKQRLTVIIPKATVVITNPTHYAIAIKYDPHKDKAPRVIAKGKGLLAQQIRQLAIVNAVQIYPAPFLARAIYNTSKLNAEINPGLYMAVAIVLSYVNQLKNYQYGIGQQPQLVSDLKIPDEFIYHE